jgi:hypothetical protein
MFMSHQQTSTQNHYIKTADNSFENVAMFKHLGTTATNQNCVHGEIKSRLNLRKACSHAV